MFSPRCATFRTNPWKTLFDLAQYARFEPTDLLVSRAQETHGLLLQVCLLGPKSHNDGLKECIKVSCTKLLYFRIQVQSARRRFQAFGGTELDARSETAL